MNIKKEIENKNIFIINIFLLPLTEVNQSNMFDKYYYNILWMVLNLFENDEIIYKDILKIYLYKKDDNLFVGISIFSKETYNKVMSILLENNKKKELFLWKNKFVYELNMLNLNVFPINYKKLPDKVLLKFLSPTMLREGKIYYYLPNPEKLFLQVLRKAQNKWIIWKFNYEEFKKEILNNVYITKYFLKTKQVEIKNNKRWGMVWEVLYNIKKDNLSKGNLQLLELAYNLIPYFWVWAWTRLWLWNVVIK